MHISLFAMLVMHGPQGTHLPSTPGTEAQDPPPQLEPGWGWGWIWLLLGCPRWQNCVQTNRPNPDTALVAVFLSCWSLSLLCC